MQSFVWEKIKGNLDGKKVFVFTSQVVASAWLDFAAEALSQGGKPKALPERLFIAWDAFKERATEKQSGERPVNSAIRRLFAEKFLRGNAEKPFLSAIVSKKYAAHSKNFAPWLASILPQLSALGDASKIFGGDSDWTKLSSKYGEFLKSRNLYEPSTRLAQKKISEDEEYILFFPDLMNDYAQIAPILEGNPQFEILKADEIPAKKPVATQFSNSRDELAFACESIKALCEQGVPLEKIAISVPDDENFMPYLARELSLYGIPFTFDEGEKLGKTGAGSFFSLAAACSAENWSLSSIQSLLLNEKIPWNAEAKAMNANIVRFGIENKCVCAFTKNGAAHQTSSWESAFASRQNSPKGEGYDFEFGEMKARFDEIQKSLQKMAAAKTFQNVLSAYRAFAEKFFIPRDELRKDGGGKKIDNIVARCNIELQSLIEIEKNFSELKSENPLNFFAKTLDEKIYKAQEKNVGARVFQYTIAAAAPFMRHFVVNCGQNAVEKKWRPFAFLSEILQKKLPPSFAEQDLGEKFLKVYAMDDDARFSFSETTFGRETCLHPFFAPKEEEKTAKPLLERTKFGAIQKRGFNFMKKAFEGFFDEPSFAERQNVAEFVKEKKVCQGCADDEKDAKGQIRTSASDLNDFAECPQKWLLSRIFGFDSREYESSLIEPKDTGSFKHKMIEFFLKNVQNEAKNSQIKTISAENLEKFALDACEKAYNEELDAKTRVFKTSFEREMIFAQKERDKAFLKAFAKKFCDDYADFVVKAQEEKKTLPRYNGENVFLKGKIDCILADSEGNGFLIDFKAGKAPSASDCRAKEGKKTREPAKNFQFAAYFELLGKIGGKYAAQGAAFYALKEMTSKKIFDEKKSKQKDEFFSGIAEDFAPLCKEFACAIEKGEFHASEKYPVKRASCKKCAFRSFCRTEFSA